MGHNSCPPASLPVPSTRVAFPIFAAAHSDKELLRTGLRKAITMVMMLNIPVMLGMAVTARLLVLVLFGKQWLPCVQYLQILCLGGIFWPLHVLNLEILTAQGHSNLFFRLEVIKKVVGIVILGSACFFGINAIAWSMLSLVWSAMASMPITAVFSSITAPCRRWLTCFPLAASLIMAFCVWIGFHASLAGASPSSVRAGYDWCCHLHPCVFYFSPVDLYRVDTSFGASTARLKPIRILNHGLYF